MKIALVGNQNSGKTTLFNLLTGMNAKIGNWPGVTIEKKTGIIRGTNYEITDLPGIYSLSPYSIEEDVSRKFIFEEKPDIIINIVDSTSLERSLYLTTQLLELDCKVIIALNMMDILEKKGVKLDINQLEYTLQTKVIRISALKGSGIDDLIRELHKEQSVNTQYIYDAKLENFISRIQYYLPDNMQNKRFIAVKLLENDNRFEDINTYKIKKVIEEAIRNYDTDLGEVIATERYEFIKQAKEKVMESKPILETFSDKLDKIFLNKILGVPIFVIVMSFIYYLAVGVVGNYTVNWMSSIVENVSEKIEIFLSSLGIFNWLISLIVDGIIAGVGTVIGFIPQLIILFLCISILETTGYMSRIALLLDKIFRKIGLSGKSLIPFIIGSGCSVPGIMGTRILENKSEKDITSILVPFIPCSAKLPIIAIFSNYFFGKNAGIVSVSIYFLAIAIIIISAIIMKKITSYSSDTTYIYELPEYKIPSVKHISKDVCEKVIEFIKRAGSIILICSIIIWFLVSFSFNLEYGVNIEDSILASIGKTISWIFYPMLGVKSWGATVSAIQGLVAKEQVISSMSVIAGLASGTDNETQIFASNGIFGFFTASSAYAFMIFNLFSAPCFSAIGAMKKELVDTKKLLKAVSFQIGIAWILATLAYQIGIRIEKGFNFSNILIILSIIFLVIFILLRTKNKKECKRCPYYNSCGKPIC